MAGLATFTPGAGNPLEIGGSSGNIPGPMPRYSISTETLRSDAVNLGQRFNITVSGTAVISDSASMLVKGQRQSKIHELISYVTSNQGNAGTLVINPYGGSNPITFNDCVLVSMDAPEQDDVSQGVQSQDYSFTFEAYRITVATGRDSTDELYGTTSTLGIQDYSETWSCSLVEGLVSGSLSFGTDTPNEPVYTITQNISATGKVDETGKASYLHAKTFVDSRLTALGDNPLATLQDAARTPQDIEVEFSPADYSAYNHVYNYNKDIQGGTYSVDRTWIASKQEATMTIEIGNNIDQSADANTVSVSINVAGLDSSKSGTSASEGTGNTKYSNALSFVNAHVLDTYIILWAAAAYMGSGALNTTAVSTSRSDNKSDGTISISKTFNDKEISTDFPCAIDQTISINDTNRDGGNDIVAILAVIAKSDGPVIQDMGTTNEKTRSVTLDLQIKKEGNCRDDEPTTSDGKTPIQWITENYKPDTTAYRTNASSNWSPSTGAYSASVDFVWV